MDIKVIVKTIESLQLMLEEVGTSAEQALVLEELARWERELDEAVKAKIRKLK